LNVNAPHGHTMKILFSFVDFDSFLGHPGVSPHELAFWAMDPILTCPALLSIATCQPWITLLRGNYSFSFM